MAENSETNLPKVLADLKNARDNKKKWDAKETELKPQAIAFLEKSGNSVTGAKLIKTETWDVQAQPAMDWAKANLPKKEFENLFVMAFDKNAFIELARKLRKEAVREARKTPGAKPKRVIPKGIVTKKETQSVRF